MLIALVADMGLKAWVRGTNGVGQSQDVARFFLLAFVERAERFRTYT